MCNGMPLHSHLGKIMRRSASGFYAVSLFVCMVCLGLVSCGGGGGGGEDLPTPAPGSISLLAGSLQSAGTADGQGSAAQFSGPEGVALDKAGNLYVTDTAAHTVRKVTPDGVVTTLAGMAGQAGSDDGQGSAARFASPRGIALDAAGNVYVADSGTHVIRKISPAGLVTTWVGAAGQSGNADGAANTARLNQPTRLTFDSAGVLYVTDQNQTVRKVTPSGVVSTFVTVQDVTFDRLHRGLTGIAVDAAGYVYVAELTGAIRKFAPDGMPVAWGAGTKDGKVTISGATDLAVDTTGAIMVAVGGSYSDGPCFSSFGNSVEKIGLDGSVQHVSGRSVVYGCGGSGTRVFGNLDGASAVARFSGPNGLAIDPLGNVWIADTGNHAVRKISLQAEVSTVAGGSSTGNVDGQGAAARFHRPRGIAVSGEGSLLVTDVGNEVVREVGQSGAVSTLTVFTEQNSEGFNFISGLDGPIAVDNTGSIFVSTREARILSSLGKIDRSRQLRFQEAFGGVMAMATNLSVNGLYIATRSGAIYQLGAEVTNNTPTTGLSWIQGLVVNSQGTLYAADSGNHTVSAIDSTGKVRLLAGQTAQAGYQDGAGSMARFDFPSALALDDAGNLYVADRSCTIRKITPNATVTTIAGTAGQCSVVLGNLPGALGAISGLAWTNGALFALTGNAVVKISLPTN